MTTRHTYAPWLRRGLAYVIDNFILIPYVFALFAPAEVRRLVLLAGSAFFIWSCILHQGTTGQSVGRKLTRTRLVDEYTGKPIGKMRNFIRGFVHTIDFVPLCIGFLRPLWHKRSQTWADSIMHTVVIYEPREREGWAPIPQGEAVPATPDEEELAA